MDAATYRKKGLWIAVLVLAVTVLLSRCFSQAPPAGRDVQLARVVRGSFDINVHTVGVLDAARTHMVSSTIGGDQGKIISLVEDGDLVAKDDILVQLDATPFETEVHRLSGEVRSLEASVESAQQFLEWQKNQKERDIRTAEFNLTVAKLELRRLVEGDGPLQLSQYKNELDQHREDYERQQAYIADLEKLRDQGYDNPTESAMAKKKMAELAELFETARQRYDSYKEHVLPTLTEAAKAKVDKAGAEIEQTRKGTEFEVGRAVAALAEVQGKLETARAALQLALAELKKTTIRAPFGGIAILYEAFRDGQTRKPRVGDRVWQNQPLLYLPDISTMIVKTQIREVDLHKVAIGQPCTVGVDAYPNTRFRGKVTAIGMLATERHERGLGEKYFQMTVTLQGEDRRLRPGMTARITVAAGTAKDTLLVPIQAVFDDGSGTFCYLFDGKGSYRKQKVVTRHQNEDLVEIVSGLSEGDAVSLLRPPSERIVSEHAAVEAP
jgi:HlyD family secretion protein